MLWASSCFKIKSSIYFSEASKWMFISRCPYKETQSSFFPHFLICLYCILLLVVFFFLGNSLCHSTEILLTKRIVSPVRHVLIIQVRVLILILHGIKMQVLVFMAVCSVCVDIVFPSDFFRWLQARVKYYLKFNGNHLNHKTTQKKYNAKVFVQINENTHILLKKLLTFNIGIDQKQAVSK